MFEFQRELGTPGGANFSRQKASFRIAMYLMGMDPAQMLSLTEPSRSSASSELQNGYWG
jgi:hypothetical protein